MTIRGAVPARQTGSVTYRTSGAAYPDGTLAGLDSETPKPEQPDLNPLCFAIPLTSSPPLSLSLSLALFRHPVTPNFETAREQQKPREPFFLRLEPNECAWRRRLRACCANLGGRSGAAAGYGGRGAAEGAGGEAAGGGAGSCGRTRQAPRGEPLASPFWLAANLSHGLRGVGAGFAWIRGSCGTIRQV
jgi:hypothetical protein